MRVISLMILGIIVGALVSLLGEKYNAARFGKEDKITDHKPVRVIVTIALCLITTGICCYENLDILTSIKMIILSSALPILAWTDIKKGILPNMEILLLAIIRVAILVAEIIMYPDKGAFVIAGVLLGLLIGGGLFLPIKFITKNGIGMGDIKLYAVVGLYLGGISILRVQVISLFVAMLYGFAMLFIKGDKFDRSIRLGPFIAVGAMLALALGM